MTAPTIPLPASGSDVSSSVPLQACLVGLLDLALQGKQAHWNVVGPRFRPVHLELDEIVASAHDGVDAVAERLAALGVAPDGRAATVAATSPLEPFPAGPVPDREATSLVGGRLEVVTALLRRSIDETAADPISQGILIVIGEALEKHAWMLRAQAS